MSDELTNNNLTLDDMEVLPSHGTFDDGTEFFLSTSRKYLLTLPQEGTLGIQAHGEDVTDHRALGKALKTLTGEEFGEARIDAELDDGGILVDGIERDVDVAEHLQDAL